MVPSVRVKTLTLKVHQEGVIGVGAHVGLVQAALCCVCVTPITPTLQW